MSGTSLGGLNNKKGSRKGHGLKSRRIQRGGTRRGAINSLPSYQRNIGKYLQLDLSYGGRQSEDSKTIHTGNVQLKAYF